jgi:hypothetical protein
MRAVKNGELYPRAIVDVLHGIIYEEKTWVHYWTGPEEVAAVFFDAWLVYNDRDAEGSQNDFESWVLADFRQQLEKATLQSSLNAKRRLVNETNKSNVFEFKQAA